MKIMNHKILKKDNIKTYLFSLKTYCFILSIIGTILSYLAYLRGHIYTSRMGIICVFASSFLGCILSALEYKKLNYSVAKQMFGVYFIFTLLWNLAFLSEYSTKTYYFVIVFGLITLNLSTLFWFSVMVNKRDILSDVLQWMKRNRMVLVLISIFCLLSFEVINDWFRVDSYAYYEYIKNAKAWDFTFETFRLLQYCAHNCFGYSLFSLIGEYLLPGNGYGVRIIQIIMMCISIGAFSNIIKKLKLDNESEKENMLITSIFAFSPIIMGLLFEVALDLATACFFTWFLYSYLNEKKVYETATVFLLIFSKETGIILLFGFGLGWLIKNILMTKSVGVFVKNSGIRRYFCLFVLPAIFYVVVFLLSDKWLQTDNSSNIQLDGSQINKFGINIDNIIAKCKEFGILNYNWLIFFCIILGGVIFFKPILNNWKSNESVCKKPILFPIIGSTVAFFLFNIFYITYCNPRYITAFYIPFILFFACVIVNLKKESYRIAIYLSIAVLLLVQNFFTLDILTRCSFKNISIGKGTIITTRVFGKLENGDLTTDEKIWSERELTHAASYNRQYTYLGDLFEKFLKTIQYSDTTLIAVAPTYGEYMTNLSVFGQWNLDSIYYYNPLTQHVVLDNTQQILNIQIVDTNTIIDFDAYERVYLVYFPYREKYYTADTLLKNYEIIDSFDVEHRLWLLHAYQLK